MLDLPAGLDDEFAVTHDEQAIDFDGAATGNDVDVDGGIPICSGELRVGVAKSNVQAGHLLVLQEVAYEFFETGECANGEFARTVAVGDGEEVVAHLLGHSDILTIDLGDIALLHGDDDGVFQYSVLVREVVAQDVADEDAVNGGRCCVDFTLGQVAPFSLLVIASMTGDPMPIFVECRSHVAASGGGDVNGFSMAHKIIDLVVRLNTSS